MTVRRLHSLRLVAAAALVAAAGAVLPAGPAGATSGACPTASGVTVVVDFTAIGGGIATTCVPGGGGQTAFDLLDADHGLTRDDSYPGVVCMVDSSPSDAECHAMPPGDAYWGLFWSRGKDGAWTYSNEGVDNLTVPDGGSVAMAWQDGGSTDKPGVAPPQQGSSQPSASSSPSTSGGHQHGGGSHSGPRSGGTSASTAPSSAPSAGAGSTPSAAPSSSPSADGPSTGAGKRGGGQEQRGGRDGRDAKHPQREKSVEPAPPGATGSATPSDDPSDAVPAADPAAAESGRLPWWVMPALLAGIFATAGAIALERRRRRA